MRIILLVFVFFILLTGCYRKISEKPPIALGNCLESYDTIPISNIIENMSYYWKVDSMGSNGYRKVVERFLRATSNYDVGYDFILEHFGKGISNHSFFRNDKQHLYLLYYTFNTFKMGKDWEGHEIADYLIFEFDANTKKLISVRMSVG